MQNRPSGQYKLEYTPRELPDSFPIDYFHYDQPDHPITYLHRHNFLEIGYCHQGTGIFIVEDKIFPFTAGNVSIINEQELHLAQSSKGTISKWTYINCDPVRLLGNMVGTDHGYLITGRLGGPGFNNILSTGKAQGISQLVTESITELEKAKPGYQSAVRGLVWALLVKLHRTVAISKSKTTKDKSTFPLEQVSSALAYLAHHFREPVRINDCASLCHMSITNFRRVFRQATGRSPQEYLMHLRIQMASLLLQTTDKPVLDISLEIGYDSLSSFNRNFKKLRRMSPRQWRQAEKRPRAFPAV
jgi:AraC-like DNA-binding protein